MSIAPFLPSIAWTAKEIYERATELGNRIKEGTATEEEKDEFHIWQPFLIPIEPLTLEKLGLIFVLIKYLKTAQDRKQLADIAKKYLGVVGNTMSSLAKAGASSPLCTIIHGRIAVSVYETLGLIPPQQARVLHSDFEWALNKLIVKDMLRDITGLGSMVFGEALPSLKAAAGT